MKICNVCGSDKKYYARGLCRVCYNKKRYHSLYSKDPRQKELRSINGKRYYQENKEKVLARQKEIRSLHGDLIRERVRNSQRKLRERIKKTGFTDADIYRFGGNKKTIYERDGYCCVSCGLSEKLSIKMYGVRLLIHHIDGNGSNKYVSEKNNDPSNLVTLCIPCHVKEHRRWDIGLEHRTLEEFIKS